MNKRTIPCHQTREGEDHSGDALPSEDKTIDQLGERKIEMEKETNWGIHQEDH